MDQGPTAIASSSAIALSNQIYHSVDERKNCKTVAKVSCQNDGIVDVVEASDRDPRERLEYSSSHSNPNCEFHDEVDEDALDQRGTETGGTLDLEA